MTETVNKQWSQLNSNYPLRTLGISEEQGELYISEEERLVNFHIIGAPGEGKSKFIVYNAIQDIKAGNGLCVLDPTSNGSTAREILQYCASINHKKVCLIDHTTLYKYGKVACIRPLWGREVEKDDGTKVIYPDKAAIGGVLEAVSISAGVKNLQEQKRLKRRLSALLRTLIKHDATLCEAEYFSEWNNPLRFNFLGNDKDSDTIESNFRSQQVHENYFSSTVNALNDFWDEPLSLMLAADSGVDFQKMLREKWTILVNLCPAGDFSSYDSQLLGVLLISQILQAADTLTRNRWKGRFYMYVDEVGRFATPQMDDILASRRHIGLSLILAHQFFGQFENKRLLESISQNTGVKVMFNVREHVDRIGMMKALGYGGQITPEMAAYANQNLPKQYAIIRKNKDTPIRVRTPDVHVPNIDVDKYVQHLLEQEWCLSRDQINSQINARKLSKDSKRPGRGKASNGKTDNAAPKKAGGERRDGLRKDSQESPDPAIREPFKF